MRKFAKSTNALDSTSSISRTQTTPAPQDPSSAEPPKSPVRSEHSSDTRPSSENSRSVADSTAQSSITNVTALTSPPPSVNDKEKRQFTGSITIPKSGFIRGDVVEIKVNIKLTKLVKSLHGLIVTLFRQTRVDTYSNIRPRDVDGAGGVARRLPPIFRADVRSLSNRGDYHLFRKDLAQSFAPIIINPETMCAEARASLRVPDDAFPTIANVPGAIIGFRYMIEVLVDMKGKLARLERFLPPPTTVSVQGVGGDAGAAGAHATMYGMHPINTDDIRAQTAVYHERLDVLIGTRDSSRTSKWKQQRAAAAGRAASPPRAGGGGKAPAVPAADDAAPQEAAHCAHCRHAAAAGPGGGAARAPRRPSADELLRWPTAAAAASRRGGRGTTRRRTTRRATRRRRGRRARRGRRRRSGCGSRRRGCCRARRPAAATTTAGRAARTTVGRREGPARRRRIRPCWCP